MELQKMSHNMMGSGSFHFACNKKVDGNVVPARPFSSISRLCRASFAPNLALGGNKAPRTPVKVVWGTPKGAHRQITHFCWDPFGRHFSVIFDMFFVRFSKRSKMVIFTALDAKLGPKRGVLEGVFTTFWDRAEPVKIVLSCGFWLGSEGWRLSQIDEFSELLHGCFSGASLNDILTIFMIFVALLGGWFGQILQQF